MEHKINGGDCCKRGSLKSLKMLVVLSLMILFTIALAINVIADTITCAIIEPDTGDTLSAGTIMNASFTGGTGNATMNLFINFSSPSTANSTVKTLVVNQENLTGALLMADNSINSSFLGVLEDSNDYTVEMAVEGGDGNGRVDCSGTATGVTVDRTTPTAATSLSPTSGTTTVIKDQTFSATVVGEDTTGCTLDFIGSNPNEQSYTMVHTGNTCTVSLTGIPQFSYDWLITASDGTDSTTSSVNTLTIDGTPGSGGRRAAVIAAATGQPLTREGVAAGLGIATATVTKGVSIANAKVAIQNEFTVAEGKKTAIGAIGGAIVGTFIFPVVGTVIGGIIGAIIGAIA